MMNQKSPVTSKKKQMAGINHQRTPPGERKGRTIKSKNPSLHLISHQMEMS